MRKRREKNPDAVLRDWQVDLYELSQMPQFPALFELLKVVANDHYAPMPRTADQVVAYETSNAVDNTIRAITMKLRSSIEVGMRLTEPPDSGGEANAESANRRGREPRKRC